MKSYLILLFIVMNLNQVTPGDEVLGVWWTPEKDGKIEVYVKQGEYYGKIIWGEEPEKDKHNPDPALRDRDVVGLDIFEGFRFNKRKKRWDGGTIYDPNSDKTYECKMWFPDGNPDKLKVRGFIGISLLGRTEVFERVK